MTSFGKWTPVTKFRPKNHIKSSDYEDAVPFEPLYMQDPPDMQLLMSNSYAKKWKQEKATFKEKLLEIQNENTVFLMRRYIVRGLAKKMRDLEVARRAPSRVVVGKKVPFAVSLRPPDASSSKNTVSKSRENSISKPISPVKLTSSSSHRSKKVETGDECRNENPSPDLEELNRELYRFAQTDTHVHVRQTGRKFKIYPIKCPKNHYHDCDCEVQQSPCDM